MNRLGARWTANEIDKLIELMKLEKPVAEIAEELGRCQKGVRTKYRRVTKGH